MIPRIQISLLLFHRLLPQNFSVFRISLEGWIFESPFSWPAVKSLKFLRRFQRQVESWITLCEGAPAKPQKTKTWFSIRKPLAFCLDCHCQVNLNPSFCVWWEQPLFLDILQIVDDNDYVNHDHRQNVDDDMIMIWIDRFFVIMIMIMIMMLTFFCSEFIEGNITKSARDAPMYQFCSFLLISAFHSPLAE